MVPIYRALEAASLRHLLRGMNRDIPSRFLDNSSLLTTPKSPKLTSTGFKENVRRKNVLEGNDSTLFNSIFSTAHDPSETVLPLADITNVENKCEPHVLTYDESVMNKTDASNATCPLDDDSSLGIISFRSSIDSFLHEHLPVRKEQSKTNQPLFSEAVSLAGHQLPKSCDPFMFSDYLSKPQNLRANHECSIFRTSALSDINMKLETLQESLLNSHHPDECKDEGKNISTTGFQSDVYVPAPSLNKQRNLDINAGNQEARKSQKEDGKNETKEALISEDLCCSPRLDLSEKRKTGISKLLMTFHEPVKETSTCEVTYTPSNAAGFADTSSFQVDEMYQKGKPQPSILSKKECENLRREDYKMCESEVVFSDDQISARSSSVGSPCTRKVKSTTDESREAVVKDLCDLNDSEFLQLKGYCAVNEEISADQIFGGIDCDNLSLGMGDMPRRSNSIRLSEMEIRSLVISGKKELPEVEKVTTGNVKKDEVDKCFKNVNAWVDSNPVHQAVDANYCGKKLDASTAAGCHSNLNLHTNLVEEGPAEMIADGENWETKLGLLEHEEFYSSDVAADLLKKDQEEFEQDHKFQVDVNDSVLSQFSTFSYCQRSKISRPSWWSEVDDSKISKSASHVSFGQFIAAKTENLGSLSDDQNRERPCFGTVIGDSPNKLTGPSSMRNVADEPEKLNCSNLPKKISFAEKTAPSPPGNDTIEQSSVMRYSAISNILAEASSDEPSVVASKLQECARKTSKIRSKRNKSFVKDYVDCLKTIEEQHSSEVQVNDLLISKSNSLIQKRDLQISSCKKTETCESSGASNALKQNTDINIKSGDKFSFESAVSHGELKCLSSTTNEAIGTKQIVPAASVHRSESLNCLCSNPSCEAHVRNRVLVGNASGAHYMSLENISVATEDSGFSKTESEVNRCSQATQSTDQRKSSHCNNCTSDLPYHPCSAGLINVGGLQFAPVHHSVFCAPSGYVKQFHTPQSHLMRTVQPSVISNMHTAGQNTQQLYSSLSSVDFLNTAKPVHAASMQVHPVCPGASFGCLVPHSISGPPTTNCARVEVPSELIFPKETCIGDSQFSSLPLHNSLPAQLFCHIAISSTKINDASILPEISGFNIPKLVQVNGGSTTDLKVEFFPKQAGKMIAVLHIIPSFSMLEQPENFTSDTSVFVTVSCEAVSACVTLRCNDTDRLDFDSVIGGSTHSQTITLSNAGKADVPVRLVISGDINEKHSVRFGLQEINSMKNSCLANWQFMSPKIIFCRIFGSTGESENKINIPVILYAAEYESQCGNNDPEVITGSITAVLDSSSFGEMLASVRTSATIGKAQVELKHQLKKPLVLKSKEGSKTSQPLTVINKGNIAVTVDLAVEDSSNCFSVSPPTVHLIPLQEASLAVTYIPISQGAMEVKGLLQAAVHHSGQVYNLAEIVGRVTSSFSSCKSQLPQLNSGHLQKIGSKGALSKKGSSSTPLVIESNKKYLAWGGVNIGEAVLKSFGVRNPSSTDVLLAKVYLKQKSSAFHFGDCDVSKQCIDFKLQPTMEKILNVVFQPTDVSPAVGKLIFKTDNQSGDRAFTVPLSGYGGVSKIKILNVPQKEGFGHCLDIIPQDQCGRYMSKISMCNDGDRAAYVKLVCFADENLDYSTPNTKIKIQPSEFILLEKESKDVLVTHKSEDVQQFEYQSPHCGVIVLLYGDEILRQKMRKSQGTAASRISPPDTIKGINFDGTFLDEDKVPTDSSFPDSPKDVALFYSSMERLVVHLALKTENQSFSRMATFSTLSFLEDSSICSSPNQTVFHRSTAVLPWTVSPSELTLSYEKWDGRLLLTSESEHDLKFKLLWSVNYICVSPVQGVLPAKGQMGLRVQIVPLSQAKLLDTINKCFIQVLCEGQEKLVPVIVCGIPSKEKQMPKSPKSNLLTSEACPNTTSTSPQQSIFDISNVKLKQQCPLKIPESIVLNKTAIVGTTTECTFQMENTSDSSVRWTVVPLDVPTTKKSSKAKKISNAVQFVPSEGVIEPSQSITAVVKFTPFETGLLRQQWEIQMDPLHGKKCKAHITVEGMARDETASNMAGGKQETNLTSNNQNNDACQSSSEKTSQSILSSVSLKPKKTLYSSPQCLDFPITEVGKSCSLKVTLKNPSTEAVKATFECPLPFNVRHKEISVRGKYYTTVPVHFKPIKAGTSECLLAVHTDAGYVIEIKLKGTSVLARQRN